MVEKEALGFPAAHFIAFPGFREPLHGHNYTMSVRIEGILAADGFVVDFCVVKQLGEALCRELTDSVLLPVRSDCLRVTPGDDVVEVITEEGHRFVFPKADCRLLPIVHTSAEEIAAYLLGRLRDGLGDEITKRGVTAIEVGVAEAPGQVGYCRETV